MVWARFSSSSSCAWVASSEASWVWTSLNSSVTSWVVAFSLVTSTARARIWRIAGSYRSGGSFELDRGQRHAPVVLVLNAGDVAARLGHHVAERVDKLARVGDQHAISVT